MIKPLAKRCEIIQPPQSKNLISFFWIIFRYNWLKANPDEIDNFENILCFSSLNMIQWFLSLEMRRLHYSRQPAFYTRSEDLVVNILHALWGSNAMMPTSALVLMCMQISRWAFILQFLSFDFVVKRILLYHSIACPRLKEEA